MTGAGSRPDEVVAPPGQQSPIIVSGAKRCHRCDRSRASVRSMHTSFSRKERLFSSTSALPRSSALGHIKGAIIIPGSQIVGRFHEVTPRQDRHHLLRLQRRTVERHAASNSVNHA